MKQPIANHKAICRKLAPPGYVSTGYADGFYLFQKQTPTGWLKMKCLEEDLNDYCLGIMAEMGLTR